MDARSFNLLNEAMMVLLCKKDMPITMKD